MAILTSIAAGIAATATTVASTYAFAINVLDFPNKFPPPLNTIMFIFLIWFGWGAVYDLALFLGLNLNLWGIVLDGSTVAMVYVAAWSFKHFVGSL